jgi:hypothetical protein
VCTANEGPANIGLAGLGADIQIAARGAQHAASESSHATGQHWRNSTLVTQEKRILDSQEGQPQLALLAAGALYTTYAQLRQFLMSEVERLAPGRVTFHGRHRLMVRTS